MGELLTRAFTEQALLDAWSDMRDAALADGEAGHRTPVVISASLA